MLHMECQEGVPSSDFLCSDRIPDEVILNAFDIQIQDLDAMSMCLVDGRALVWYAGQIVSLSLWGD